MNEDFIYLQHDPCDDIVNISDTEYAVDRYPERVISELYFLPEAEQRLLICGAIKIHSDSTFSHFSSILSCKRRENEC